MLMQWRGVPDCGGALALWGLVVRVYDSLGDVSLAIGPCRKRVWPRSQDIPLTRVLSALLPRVPSDGAAAALPKRLVRQDPVPDLP